VSLLPPYFLRVYQRLSSAVAACRRPSMPIKSGKGLEMEQGESGKWAKSALKGLQR